MELRIPSKDGAKEKSVKPGKTVSVVYLPFTDKRNLGRHVRIAMFGADEVLSDKKKYLGLVKLITKCTKAL